MHESHQTKPKVSLTRFAAQPHPLQAGVILAVTTAAYVLAFILLTPTWGLSVAALATVPIMAAGWLLGLRAGLLTGSLVFVLDVLLFQLVGRLTETVVFQSLPGHFALIVIGAGVGHLSDLTARLRQQIAARQAAENALQQAKEELALKVSERTAELKAVNEQLQVELAERRRAEAAVKASEQRFRALIENSADAITLFDATGKVVYDSPAAPGMLGYAPGELVGQNLFEYVHPDDAPLVGSLFGQLLQAPRVRSSGEFRFRHKDGSWRWLEGVATNLQDDSNVGALVANYRDITERKQAEEETRRQAARAEALARTASRLNAQLDLETVLRTVCQEAATTLNAPAAAITLVDAARQVIYTAGDYGLPPEYRQRHRPVPLAEYARLFPGQAGPAMVLPDVQAIPGLPEADLYADLDIRTVASVALARQGHPLGSLNVILVAEVRQFTEDELVLLQGLADQAAQAISNARLFEDAQRRLKHTQALRNIDIAITGSLDLRMTLNILLKQVTTQLNVAAADVLLLNSHTQMLDYAAGRGFRTQAIAETRRRLGEGNAGRAALERRLVHIPNLPSVEASFGRTALLIKEDFIAYYGVPLIAKGQVKGVLEVFHRAPLDPDPEWLAFMEALAGQAAIAIDSATLFEDLQRSNTELALAYDTTLEGWSAALDLRDKETEGHTQRVTEMTLKLARTAGFSDAELVQVRRGALLHDIGKMGIPDSILLKPGKLTDEEWVIMRQHPQYAYDLLHPIAYLRPALEIPYCHHEKWDGSGYPRGLKGEQIPLTARLFAVVDVWDALRSDRPYRQAWPDEKVREHIQSLTGTHFDPAAVAVFLSVTGESSPNRSG